MQARYPLLTLTFLLTACGSQELGPTETSGWEDDGREDDGADASDSSSGSATDTSETGSSGDEGFNPICLPGDMRCDDDGNIELCADTGLEWVVEECSNYTECKLCIGTDDPLCEGVGARCAGPCDPDQKPASSEGCSFVATHLFFVRPGHPGTHSLFVGNNDPEGRDATVDFISIQEGTRDEVIEETIVLAPGEAHQFELKLPQIMTGSSLLRTGGIYRIKSDLPVSAVQMAPHPPDNRQPDSSLLLPEEAERTDFVVPGAPGQGVVTPQNDSWSGYATIIALHDDTEVTYSIEHTNLYGNGAPLHAAEAGEEVSVILHRYDNIRITATKDDPDSRWEDWDIGGLKIHSSEPISVFSGTGCGVYPNGSRTCDHMQEQVFPLTYWGTEYIGPSSPDRELVDLVQTPMMPIEQRTYWRIYAGGDDTTVTITPPVPELPLSMDGNSSVVTLEKRGDYELFSSDLGTHLHMSANRAFLPVQFHQSGEGSAEVPEPYPLSWETSMGGDPSMCQMVPAQQWLNDYTFLLTGKFDREYLQITRRTGNADVIINGPAGMQTVTDWETVGEFEVSTVFLDADEEGDYRVSSEDDFGLLQGGDNISEIPFDNLPALASYCHPGGIRIMDIFAP